MDVGVDPAEPVLRLAASRGLEVVGAVGEGLPFRDGSFGGVFLIVTLCFLEDPELALSEVFRVLKLGGRLVVGFIPLDSPWGQLYSELARQGHRFYRYARLYRVEEVEELVRGAGFTPELYVSTLRRSRPGVTEVFEEPSLGLWEDAGFVVLRALKGGEGSATASALGWGLISPGPLLFLRGSTPALSDEPSAAREVMKVNCADSYITWSRDPGALPFLGRWWFVAAHVHRFHGSLSSTSQRPPRAPSPRGLTTGDSQPCGSRKPGVVCPAGFCAGSSRCSTGWQAGRRPFI